MAARAQLQSVARLIQNKRYNAPNQSWSIARISLYTIVDHSEQKLLSIYLDGVQSLYVYT